MKAAAADSGESWIVAAAALAIGSLSFGAVTSVPIMLRPMANDLGWSHAAVAFAHTLAMFSAAGVSVFMGQWLDRHGFAPIAIIGACGSGLGLVLASFASQPWQLYLAFGLAVGGLGQGAFFSPLIAAVSLWFERHRALAIALASAGQSVGGLLFPAALRQAEVLIGWRMTMLGYGVVCVVALLVLSRFVTRAPPSPVSDEREPPHPAGPVHRAGGRLLAALTVALGCTNLAAFIVIAHLIAFAEERGFAALAAAQLLSVLLGVSLLSRLAGGWFADRFGIAPTVLGATTLQACGCLLLALSSEPMALHGATVLIGLGFGAFLPGYGAWVRKLTPRLDAGKYMTRVYGFAFVAAGLGSWVGGMLRDLHGDYQIAFVVAGALSATGLGVAAACASTVRRQRRGAVPRTYA